MPKVARQDKILHIVDQARRRYMSGDTVLKNPTPEGDLSETYSENLNRTYKHRYNPHLRQLHDVGATIKLYRTIDKSNSEIRNTLGITKKQYYIAQTVHRLIQKPEVIPYLEELSVKEVQDLTQKEVDYVCYGAWPYIEDTSAEKDRKDKE